MNFTFYNMMTARGFSGGMGMQFFMAWIGLSMLVLIGAIAKKWLGEEEMLGIPYNWLGSLLGVFFYIGTIAVTGSSKIALVLGLAGMLFGGFGAGQFLGGGE